jgi:hypothetical protein
MPLNFGADFSDPNNMALAAQLGMQYLKQFMQGPQGTPTMATRRFAQDIANQMGGELGSAYDSSWVKPYLGYGTPGVGLDLQKMQMQFASQNAQNNGGVFDQSLMPSMPVMGQGATPTLQQRQYAMNWANTMGQYDQPFDEAKIQSYMQGPQGGISPALQQLQRQYALQAVNRTGNADYLNGVQNTMGGTATANQMLNNLNWANLSNSVMGQAFNPTTGQWDYSPEMKQALAQQALGTVPADSWMDMLKNIALDAVAKLRGVSQPNQPAPNGGGMGGLRQTEAETNNPTWTAKDNRDVDALKATYTQYDKATALRDLKAKWDNNEVADHVYSAMKRWINQTLQ